MSASVTRWKVRDPAKLRDWGLATLQACRAQRGREEVVSSRYYFSTGSEIVIHTEFKPGVEPTVGIESPEVAKSAVDLLMLAENTGVEPWIDAAVASEGVARGGFT